MSTTRLTIPQWQTWVKGYGKRALEAGQRGLMSGGLRAVAMLQKATRQAPPSDPGGQGTGGAFNTGEFLRGWRMQVFPGRMFVFNSAPYADIIEEGRRPGSKPPPRASIEAWARRRLGLSAEDAKSAAWAIAKAIGERGLRGRHILRDANPAIKRAIEEEINRELQRELHK